VLANAPVTPFCPSCLVHEVLDDATSTAKLGASALGHSMAVEFAPALMLDSDGLFQRSSPAFVTSATWAPAGAGVRCARLRATKAGLSGI
jgi:hypothetical protein